MVKLSASKVKQNHLKCFISMTIALTKVYYTFSIMSESQENEAPENQSKFSDSSDDSDSDSSSSGSDSDSSSSDSSGDDKSSSGKLEVTPSSGLVLP